MAFWKRTMDYLGLGPDDAYDDYDEPVEPEPQARGSRSSGNDNRGRSRGGQAWPADPEDPAVRAVPARPSYPSRDFESPARRSAQPSDDSGAHARSSRAPSPRVTVAPPGEPATVRPRRFDQAQELADKFKLGQAVILNLESTERDVARRLIDFASGVCYSLDGSMEKVATGVYLLKPSPERVHRIDDYEG
jgi:cell division inhibitor SepF